MKLVCLKSALKFDSFDVTIGIKIPFFRVLVTIELGRSLLQFVTTNCLKRSLKKDPEHQRPHWKISSYFLLSIVEVRQSHSGG